MPKDIFSKLKIVCMIQVLSALSLALLVRSLILIYLQNKDKIKYINKLVGKTYLDLLRYPNPNIVLKQRNL